MDIATVTPQHLPLKALKWEKIIPHLGQARDLLARFDETLKGAREKKLLSLMWKESLSSLQKKNMQKSTFAYEGLEFAISWAKKKPINQQLICKIHAIVKKDGSTPQEIGKYRTKQNWIGPHGCAIEEAYFYPPSPKKVPKLMQELIRYQQKKEKDPLVQLACFFAQMLIIHPFMDGNGRVARILIPVWLWKKKVICKPALFLSSYFEKKRLQYFRKLFFISDENAWEEWIIYFLKGVIEQARHSQKFLKKNN